MPGVACSEMIRNPFNSNHIFASTVSGCNFIATGGYGQGIIESFDNGNTWSVMSGFPNQNYPFLEKIIADPNDNNSSDGLTLYAIGNQTLYKSTNTGITWTTIIFPPNLLNQYTHLSDIEIDNTGTIFLTTYSLYDNSSGQIFKFKNNTWTDISNLFPDFQRCLLSKPYNGKIFALVDNSIRTIYKTLDSGVTWTYVKSGGCLSPGRKKEIEYSPASGLVYIGDIYYICFNENTPTTTMCILPGHMDIRDIVLLGIDANGYENTLVATDGGISKVKVKVLNVNDNLYTNLNGNYLPIEEFMGLGVSKSSSEFIVAGAVHNNSFKYQNGTWTKFYGGDGGDCEVNWDNPSIFYYQGNAFMGNNSGTFSYSVGDWFIGMEFELNPTDPYIMYAGRAKTSSNNAKLLIFNEHGGSSGNGLLTTKFAPPDVSAIGAIGVNTNNVIYIADYVGNSETTPNRFVKSLNNGDSWSDLSNKIVYAKSGGSYVQYATIATLLAWKTIEDIIFNPSNSNEMWISIGAMSPDNNTGLMRVLHSTDGGNNWYDYSENLPPFPVMSLVYQLGSNNRLFAGTDAGVFYRDSTMAQWECFSKGLPVSIVSDLDYDPCSRYLYASTRGRSIFKTLVPFDDNATISLPANSIILWDKPVQLANNLIVPENTTLTITSNVYVSKNKIIIIKPNGKLIVNGAKITNQCGDMWRGIEVWGTTTLHQYTVNGVCAQGSVELKNGAILENAYNGITNWKPDDWNSIGGIIIANGATFRNNRRS